ncbi:hypothetical protein A8709_07310 [Paenibacillus pectinilyticus]|uniref:Integrase catalytic domain-containing protein n=1 Tax=Paenibacillus pectinilyticus TaxID=512399 RepID=A0A1C0ZTR1_9BACL|nr:hypothetical protein [Paenibacillus pectinilyticus]OCT11468.1 hypothetical protein A8709_07310 [Paenibacillus pectinilyticus]
MRRKSLLETLGIDASTVNLAEWPIVDTDLLDEIDRDKYERRKLAVEMYLQDSANVTEISNVTKIEKMEITRFVKRCLRVDKYGQILGFRGLNPNLHLISYERRVLPNDNTSNYSGAFELLLKKHTDLRDLIHDKILGTDKKGLKITYSVKYLHRKMIDKCIELKITPNQYPRNTVDEGRRSLERYVKDLKDRHFGNEHINGETAAMIARSVGTGVQNYANNFRPYGRVMFDGHKIDLILTIRYTDPDGNWVTKTLKRIWLLVILDVATKAVLGHLLCVKSEYSQMDVLQCIQNAINPHIPMTFTIKGLRYPEAGAFPSSCIPEAKWAVWREFWMDNAKANLAINVKDKLTKTVGCFINAGPVASPLRRGFIERFFGILEENGYHLMPSTTGSDPKDPKRKNAEKKALETEISIEHLEELTEVMLAQYNNEPHGGNSSLAPLKAMRNKILKGFLPRILPENRRQELGLLIVSRTCTIQGNLKKGRRAYINFEGAQYRNAILSQSTGLIGKKITIYINIMDIRSVRAFLPNGNELGSLRVSGKWVMSPHSLETRRTINKLLRSEKRKFFLERDDYVQALHEHLASSGKKGDLNRLAHEQRYQNTQNQTLQEAQLIENEEEENYQDMEQDSSTEITTTVNVTISNEDLPDDDWLSLFKPISFKGVK